LAKSEAVLIKGLSTINKIITTRVETSRGRSAGDGRMTESGTFRVDEDEHDALWRLERERALKMLLTLRLYAQDRNAQASSSGIALRLYNKGSKN
jgi:hypothetical protein